MATQRHAGFQLERKSGRGRSVHKVKHESMKAVASRFKDLTPLDWICISEIRNSIPPSQNQRFRYCDIIPIHNGYLGYPKRHSAYRTNDVTFAVHVYWPFHFKYPLLHF